MQNQPQIHSSGLQSSIFRNTPTWNILNIVHNCKVTPHC